MVFLTDLGKPPIHGTRHHIFQVGLRGVLVRKDTELMPFVRDGVMHLKDVTPVGVHNSLTI